MTHDEKYSFPKLKKKLEYFARALPAVITNSVCRSYKMHWRAFCDSQNACCGGDIGRKEATWKA
jgi:hypothetical protein